jgi:hypothetical protein
VKKVEAMVNERKEDEVEKPGAELDLPKRSRGVF